MSQVSSYWIDIYILKVIDLEATISANELMDLHRLERILLGRKGNKVMTLLMKEKISELKTNGMVQGQLAFRPAPTEEMKMEGLVILRRKRNELRV